MQREIPDPVNPATKTAVQKTRPFRKQGHSENKARLDMGLINFTTLLSFGFKSQIEV
jgi:hypothetical protein